MVVSEKTLKWIMRFYPPLLLQRIWVIGFDEGFKGVSVKIGNSLLNRNYNGSIFGGTIFAAADPFYPVLFNQVLNTKDRKLRIWSRSAKIDFLKPALSNLKFHIVLTDTDIESAVRTLNTEGKYQNSFPVNIYNKNNELCAALMNEVYVRDLNFIQPDI